MRTPYPRSTSCKSPSETPSGTSKLYLTYQHLVEKNLTLVDSSNTYEVKYIGGKDRDDMIGVKSKAPFSPNLAFILDNRYQAVGRTEGGVCTWSRSRHHIPERPRWSHSVSRASRNSIQSVSVVILGVGVQLTYSITFRIVISFLCLNESLQRRKDGKGRFLAVVLHVCPFPVPVRHKLHVCSMDIPEYLQVINTDLN